VWPFAGASAGACAVALLAAASVHGEARPAALYGTIAASIGGACALAALAAFADRGINGLLAGFSIGFLARGALVALGLVVSGARGNLALTYAVAFFAVYAATQVIEVLFVHKSSHHEGASS
jgi:hypothetical protein